MKPVNIGLLGLGTVGQGVANILVRNAAEIERRAGRGITIKLASVRSQGKNLAGTLGIDTTDDPALVVNDPDIDIVCEMMGGEQPALELIMTAIENGKHVITANKALIAMHGNKIFASARERGVIVAFEPAVAGGIPIIKAIREGLAANRIDWLAGIINGTGNFILSEMASKGRDFDDVLAQAQELGYAEADPEFDVEGIDAAHKLTILASIAFGIPLQFDKVYTEGISHITGADVTYAEELGYRIKHLGLACRTDRGVELRVHPTLIPEKRLLANVDGVMNAVMINADAVGETLYYGPGAGAEPTASAAVADLVDVVRTLTADPENRVPHLAFQPDSLADITALPIDQVVSAYYLRLLVDARSGVLADVTRILADLDISIEAVIQKAPPDDDASQQRVPLILLIHRVREHRLDDALRAIAALDSVDNAPVRIRLEHL